jgi:hypothetical protein
MKKEIAKGKQIVKEEIDVNEIAKGKQIVKEEIDVNEIEKEFRRIQKEENILVKKIKAKEDILQARSFRNDKKKINLNDDSIRFFVTKEGEDWLKRNESTTNLLYNCFNQKKIEEKEKSNGIPQNIHINLILK